MAEQTIHVFEEVEIPDPKDDPTFAHLVSGLARVDVRTARKFLAGEMVGRSNGERLQLRGELTRAVKDALALRAKDAVATRARNGGT